MLLSMLGGVSLKLASPGRIGLSFVPQPKATLAFSCVSALCNLVFGGEAVKTFASDMCQVSLPPLLLSLLWLLEMYCLGWRISCSAPPVSWPDYLIAVLISEV